MEVVIGRVWEDKFTDCTSRLSKPQPVDPHICFSRIDRLTREIDSLKKILCGFPDQLQAVAKARRGNSLFAHSLDLYPVEFIRALSRLVATVRMLKLTRCSVDAPSYAEV